MFNVAAFPLPRTLIEEDENAFDIPPQHEHGDLTWSAGIAVKIARYSPWRRP
jgi:hypothetical protein